MPLLNLTSVVNSCQAIPVRKTSRMPLSVLRSGIRGRPPLGLSGSGREKGDERLPERVADLLSFDPLALHASLCYRHPCYHSFETGSYAWLSGNPGRQPILPGNMCGGPRADNHRIFDTIFAHKATMYGVTKIAMQR